MDGISITKQAMSRGWIILVFGFFGFIFWASTFPLNEGVSGSGFVVNKNEKISIIAPMTGLIKKCNVSVGQRVKKGELMFEYDSSMLTHAIKASNADLIGIENSNNILKQSLQSKRGQVAALQQQFDAYDKLKKSGFVSEFALMSIKDRLDLSRSEMSEIESRHTQNLHKAESIRQHIMSQKEELNQLSILAPMDGQVMNLDINTPLINVSASQKLLEIAPEDDELVIDTKFSVNFANKLSEGMPVDVLFPTLPGSKTKRMHGTLTYLSKDKILNEREQYAYMEGKVKIDITAISNSQDIKVGIPATVTVIAGERTLMSYITRPFADRINMGIK